MRAKNLQTDLQKLLAFGAEAMITPEASSISGKNPYLIRLSDAAKEARLDFVQLSILFKQHIDAQQFFKDNGFARLPVEDIAPLAYQELFLEMLDMAGLKIGAVALPGEELNVETINAGDARTAGYPVAEDLADTDPYFVFTIPPGEPGADGAAGADGADGAPGADGSDAVCDDCTGPDGGGSGPPGGDGGGSGGTGTGGSGPDGSWGPNPDGADEIVFIPGCADPIINFPFCSDAFSFSNADIKPAIIAAVVATGLFNDATEDLVSVVLDWNGAAYGGVAEVSVPTTTEYLPPQSNTAKLLTLQSSGGNFTIPHTVEKFGLEGTLVVQGFHYAGSTGLRMDNDDPILLNGQMSNYPLIGGANCHSPADESDPAWLKVCLRQFVKRGVVEECEPLPLHQQFQRGDEPFTDATLEYQVGYYQGGPSPAPGDWAKVYNANSAVDSRSFTIPTDGNANEHLMIAATLYDSESYPAHINESGQPFESGVTWTYQNAGYTPLGYANPVLSLADFEMQAGKCYVVQLKAPGNGGSDRAVYDLKIEWV